MHHPITKLKPTIIYIVPKINSHLNNVILAAIYDKQVYIPNKASKKWYQVTNNKNDKTLINIKKEFLKLF